MDPVVRNEPSRSAQVQLLRFAARVDPSPADLQGLARAAADVTDWRDVPDDADAHGLAPLLYAQLTRAAVTMPSEARLRLAGLVLQHRHANRVRFRVLGEILEALDRSAIPVIVLKGAALAHLLYASPDLRPLSDLDLLVHPAAAARAQAVLATLGFHAPAQSVTRELTGHHHLPGAVKSCDGQSVVVEIHVDALTRDATGSLVMGRLPTAPRAFVVEGRTAYALGHADMLYHLCRHLAECAPRLRLVWVADIVGYATRYRDDIQWQDLQQRYPMVLNALSLLHLVTALPPDLLAHATPARPGLRGVGVAAKPLNEIFARGRRAREIWRDVFDPSDWWLRLYYGLDDRAPLAWYRRVRHPVKVAGWLLRRGSAQVRWRTSRRGVPGQ